MNILDNIEAYFCSYQVFKMIVQRGSRKYVIADMEPYAIYGTNLRRIIAVRNFGSVHVGDLGGFVDDDYENVLSHEGNCWIADNAIVQKGARVYDDAQVYDNAIVEGRVEIKGRARVYEKAFVYDTPSKYRHGVGDKIQCCVRVCDDVQIHGNSTIQGSNLTIGGNANLHGNADIRNGMGALMKGEYTEYLIPNDADELVKFEGGYKRKCSLDDGSNPYWRKILNQFDGSWD